MTELGEDRWKNVEIRIIYPVPNDEYGLHEDGRFDELAELAHELYPEVVMGAQIMWSDAG